MNKSLILLIILTLIQLPTFAYKVKTFSPLVPVTTPQIQKISPLVPLDTQPFESEKYPKITELEYAVFNKSYENEAIYNRLSRLENRLFQKNFSNLPLSNRVENLFSKVDEGIFYGIRNAELAKLEKKILGIVYPNDDTESRITRMEKEMLGAMQTGNIKERYETIKLASKHYNSYPEIIQKNSMYMAQNRGYYPQKVYSPYYCPGNGINGFMQNILGRIFGDIGTGTMTGYTPPIYDNYNIYGSRNNRYGMYSPNFGTQDYKIGNTGGYIRNHGYDSNSSVRIID